MPKMPAEEFDKIIEETTSSIEQLGNIHDQKLLEEMLRNLPDIARKILEDYYQYPNIVSIGNNRFVDTIEYPNRSWIKQVVTISEKLAELHLMDFNIEATLYYLELALNNISPRQLNGRICDKEQVFRFVEINLQLIKDMKEETIMELTKEIKATEIFKEFVNLL